MSVFPNRPDPRPACYQEGPLRHYPCDDQSGRDIPAWLAAHPPHWAHPPGEPVYRLPGPVIDTLARPAGRCPPPLGPAAADWERQFDRLCDPRGWVGVWGDKPVRYDPLLADGPADRLRRALAGRLLLSPEYLQEVAALRRWWDDLGHGRRTAPVCPVLLDNEGVKWELKGDDRRDLTVPTVWGTLLSLLGRWGVSALATWDLPLPQGPELYVTFPHHDEVCRLGSWVFVPVGCQAREVALVAEAVRRHNQRLATWARLPAGFADSARPGLMARCFEVQHLERAVRSRFPGRPPRGLAGAVTAALATHLDLNPESVAARQKLVRRCRAGNPPA